MKRIAITAFITCAIFAAGMLAARAQLGWRRIPAPCVPTALAMTPEEIAVTCPNESTIYLKQR